MERRDFLHASLASSLAAGLGGGGFTGAYGGDGSSGAASADVRRPPRIVLRSSWQTVNIGDIAHTPGVLTLFERHLPQAEVRLWPSKVDNGVAALLKARFPRLQIIEGAEALRTAFDECDFLLHGSGPSLVAERDVVRWTEATGKPYGVYAITQSPTASTATRPTPAATVAKTVQVLSGAKFAFFRDSASLRLTRERGCTCPIMEFAPDGAFATDLRDDARALEFLRRHRLEEGRFLCCIPRLRFTPYWTVPGKNAAFDETKHARNEAMKEHDHAPLRRAIVETVRRTDMRVLLCPEDQTQMAVGKEMLLDKLPDDVRQKVVWRPDYWLTGEALSTYVRSAGLFGNEMHSPIMCIGAGVPAIVCRWAEQTSKGLMWRDIGLGDWLFDLDREEEVERIVPAVLAMAQDPQAARAKAAKAKEFVERRQRESFATLARTAAQAAAAKS